jgi:hypothetical protein
MASQCRHLRANGVQCRAHRVWKEDYCFFHLHHRTPHGMAKRSEDPPPPPPKNGIEIPLLEDLSAIQIAIGRVLTALSEGRITAADARAYISGLRLAAANVKHKSFAPENSAETYIQYENGDVIGPEQYESEYKPHHPLMDSGLLTLRHLAERVNYEALLDAYFTRGETPPDDLRPPAYGPPDPARTKPEVVQNWLKTGWKAAQTRAQAIEIARKNIPTPDPTPIPPESAFSIHPPNQRSA